MKTTQLYFKLIPKMVTVWAVACYTQSFTANICFFWKKPKLKPDRDGYIDYDFINNVFASMWENDFIELYGREDIFPNLMKHGTIRDENGITRPKNSVSDWFRDKNGDVVNIEYTQPIKLTLPLYLDSEKGIIVFSAREMI